MTTNAINQLESFLSMQQTMKRRKKSGCTRSPENVNDMDCMLSAKIKSHHEPQTLLQEQRQQQQLQSIPNEDNVESQMCHLTAHLQHFLHSCCLIGEEA